MDKVIGRISFVVAPPKVDERYATSDSVGHVGNDWRDCFQRALASVEELIADGIEIKSVEFTAKQIATSPPPPMPLYSGGIEESPERATKQS